MTDIVDTEQQTIVARTTARGSVTHAATVACSRRTAIVVDWIGGHLFELAGTVGPGVLAFTASPWWAIPGGAVAAWWAVHELRPIRWRRAPRGALTPTARPGTPNHAPNGVSGADGATGNQEDTRGSA